MKKIKTIEAIEAARLIKEMCSKRKRGVIMRKTTVDKIDAVFVNHKEFSDWAMVYECTTCGSRFIDINDNYRLCPYCGRKIVDSKE